MTDRIALVVLATVAAAGCRGGTADRRTSPPSSASRANLAAPPPKPFVMFVSQLPDDSFKHVVIAPLNSPNGGRYVTPLVCERVHFSGSRGMCLASEVRPNAD